MIIFKIFEIIETILIITKIIFEFLLHSISFIDYYPLIHYGFPIEDFIVVNDTNNNFLTIGEWPGTLQGLYDPIEKNSQLIMITIILKGKMTMIINQMDMKQFMKLVINI